MRSQKRRRGGESDSDAGRHTNRRRPVQERPSGARPTIREQDKRTQRIIKKANAHLRIHIATKDPFISEEDATAQITHAFQLACDEMGATSVLERFTTDNEYQGDIEWIVRIVLFVSHILTLRSIHR
jgi:hypothetical protein